MIVATRACVAFSPRTTIASLLLLLPLIVLKVLARDLNVSTHSTLGTELLSVELTVSSLSPISVLKANTCFMFALEYFS